MQTTATHRTSWDNGARRLAAGQGSETRPDARSTDTRRSATKHHADECAVSMLSVWADGFPGIDRFPRAYALIDSAADEPLDSR